MTERGVQFRTVLRGYDPSQVDRRVAELIEAAKESRTQAEQLAERVRELEERAKAGDGATPPGFEQLGQRVARILILAEEEAEEVRSNGRADLDARREQLEQEVTRVRSDADRYAEQQRSEADTAAARVLENARRTADDRIDAADRDASARTQEAEALYEAQRAKAAKAAADFEATLASRRETAEQEFTTQMHESQQRLAELEAHIERSRTDAEKTHKEATRESRRIVEDAEQQAASIIQEVRTMASRVRSDSDRELAAATHRRDSINAQLANVRQMLATLTGGAPPTLVEKAFADGPEVAAQPATPAESAESTSGAEAAQPTDDGSDEVADEPDDGSR
ncbi:MAG: DivIVA domain-containing protein [Actinomycetota bacterium]|nr:DivIVA domain-containing protein [Actinomycetota bacterium]